MQIPTWLIPNTHCDMTAKQSTWYNTFPISWLAADAWSPQYKADRCSSLPLGAQFPLCKDSRKAQEVQHNPVIHACLAHSHPKQ
jgi:hypothetical protein